MENLTYLFLLCLTGIINIGMAGAMVCGSRHYWQYPVYCRTRMFSALWMGVFGVGYLLLVMGVGMFAYIGYSVSKYGTVIEEATKATEKANHINNK